MKKTLTVNLGGTVFHIDEDAYQLLDKYLSNLRIHFRKEEGSDEIMDDFEMRISELLNERVRLGYEVITIEQVEEVIKRMGKPEEIFEEEEKSTDHEDNYRAQQQETHTQTTKKRLMRDPDNRILGGVAGGFAAYMDWDPTAVRIVLFLLMFFYGITVPLYFLLWIIVPMARTATEKLEMRGQSVTVENIGKTVTDGFEKVSNNVNDFISSDKPRNFFQKLADVFVLVIGFILKFFIILAGIFLLPPLVLVVFILVVVTFALLMGGAGFIYNLSPFGADLINGAPLSMAIMGCIGTILFIGIPIFSLIYAICCQLFKVRPLPTQARWILLALWLISLVLCGVYINPVCYMTGIIIGTVYTIGTGMPFGSLNLIRRRKMKI
jgi:phage shock protein PspC (stress-responsive transcriptional regulator)